LIGRMRWHNHVGSGMTTTESRKTKAAGTRAPQNEREYERSRSRCHISLEKRQLDILVGTVNGWAGENPMATAIRHTQFLIYVIAINTHTAATSETRGLIHD
jgi:hypothetical protein